MKDKTRVSLQEAVGNTPLLVLSSFGDDRPNEVQLLAKAEWLNPSGSVKDRPALAILRAALEEGELGEGRVLLDATSGNMGIAYATFAAELGVQVALAIPGSASPERLAVLRALGVELHISDPLEGTDGAIELARRLLAGEPEKYFYADQYNNAANWQAHYETTGPEIWHQTEGAITHLVVGLGTSGTLMGAGRHLREQNPDIQIIAFQPDGAFHGLEGLKHMPSALVPGIYDADFADEQLSIRTEDAQEMTRRLAREQGIFAGVSSGAAALAAMHVAAKLEQGVVVTVFPDSGMKYLSENFWEGQS